VSLPGDGCASVLQYVGGGAGEAAELRGTLGGFSMRLHQSHQRNLVCMARVHTGLARCQNHTGLKTSAHFRKLVWPAVGPAKCQGLALPTICTT
jgi:hypothetical protein